MKRFVVASSSLILFLGAAWGILLYLNHEPDTASPALSGSAPVEVVQYPVIPELANHRHRPFGSREYQVDIDNLVAVYGPREAFAVVISDVRSHRDELRKTSEVNRHLFYRLVSALVAQVGYVDQEMHYFRNELNMAPPTLSALIQYNGSHPLNRRWYLLTPLNSIYHLQGPSGVFNLKFDSYDGYCEAVYDRGGRLLDDKSDPVNMGTYNYSPGINLPNAHTRFDVVPFLRYGNTPDSPQKNRADIANGVQKTLQNYNSNAMNIYQYRKDLFGVQSGRIQ